MKSQSPDRLWPVQQEKLKLRFAQLRDEDFRYDYGRKNEMMERLQIKLGKTRAELDSLLMEVMA